MARIITYLTFNGNCREAMAFYQECLGGELTLQTIGESPLTEKIPGYMKQHILHATLQKDGLVMLATDMVGEYRLNTGNTMSMMLDCASEEEVRNCYKKLSVGGQVTDPLQKTIWGALF